MKRSALRVYVLVVAGSGLLSASLVAFASDAPALAAPGFVMLAAYVVAGEVFPLRVLRGGRESVLTVSTTFAFAILLWLGAAEAMTALVAASIVGDALQRAPWVKVVFNAAQFAVCIALGGLVLEALRPGGPLPAPVAITDTGALATLAAAAVFFASNFVLSGIAVALSSGASVIQLLQRDFAPQLMWAGVLLSLSPIVVAAAHASLALLPLFVIPMIGVYRSTEVFLQREHQALHDPLTGLPNRMLFGDRVNQAILSARRQGEDAAVMMLDLDGFKTVNDTLGHSAGDRILRLVGERFAAALRSVDTVARLGGDEFGVVVSPVGSAAGAVEVARKLRSAAHEPLRIGDVVMTLDVSVGIALSPAHGTDRDSLVSYADAAMYEAKRVQSGIELHDPPRFEQAATRMTRLARLRHAVREGQLELHYQPKYSVSSGTVESVEALVRWNDPEEGLVLPDEFIPLAEETGLIRDVTRFVLAAAIDTARELQCDGVPQRIAVNISVRDLQDPLLPEEVGRLLVNAGVEPRWLELEITERTIMSNPEQAVAVLRQLHELGVMVTIDDFGTGNTSLGVLSQLPIDSLKVDRSLVTTMSRNRTGAVIVEATIELGHNLGMTVVAEGVETREVWERLCGLGCDIAQGTYCAPPLPADELHRHLGGGRPPVV